MLSKIKEHPELLVHKITKVFVSGFIYNLDWFLVQQDAAS